MTITCTACRRVFEIEVNAEAYARWWSGALAQEAFPDLSADDRELLISGTCGKCFDEMFRD